MRRGGDRLQAGAVRTSGGGIWSFARLGSLVALRLILAGLSLWLGLASLLKADSPAAFVDLLRLQGVLGAWSFVDAERLLVPLAYGVIAAEFMIAVFAMAMVLAGQRRRVNLAAALVACFFAVFGVYAVLVLSVGNPAAGLRLRGCGIRRGCG